MKIAVVGSGGVGGRFGARLAVGGNAIRFVARGQHLEAIQRNGLTIRSSRGDVHLDKVNAVDSVEKMENIDLVLIAVKLWDTEEVARVLRPLAEQGAAILSLQNGVEKDDVLRRFLPPGSVLGGVCYISASIASLELSIIMDQSSALPSANILARRRRGLRCSCRLAGMRGSMLTRLPTSRA